MVTTNGHKNESTALGSSFDNFLREQDMYDKVALAATKRVLAEQIRHAMEQEHLTKTQMAKRMKTSRSALRRLIDPENPNVTLQTLDKAATAIGRKLTIALT